MGSKIRFLSKLKEDTWLSSESSRSIDDRDRYIISFEIILATILLRPRNDADERASIQIRIEEALRIETDTDYPLILVTNHYTVKAVK